MTTPIPDTSARTPEQQEEFIMSLLQERGELKALVENMQIMRGDLNAAALEVARAVDDIFAQSHAGVAQRTSRVQIIVRTAMKVLLEGEKHWNWGGEWYDKEPAK